jgi:hypothetical protein
MRRDAKQHVLEIGERRDVDQFTALDERVQQRGAASPFKAPSKEPVLPADCDESELILGAGMPPARLCRVHDRNRLFVKDRECVSLGWAA